MDLHELETLLAPHGWQRMTRKPGLYRDVVYKGEPRSQFIEAAGAGYCDVWGGGLGEGTLGSLGQMVRMEEVVEYLEKRGAL